MEATLKAIRRAEGYRSRRYLLTERGSIDDIELLARGSDWTKLTERRGDQARGISGLVKWQLSPGLNVTYAEEFGLRTSSVMVTSVVDGARAVESAVAVFEAHPKIVRIAGLLAAVDAATVPIDTAVAIARAGLGAPLEPDDRFVERIEECASADDPVVREGALWAITYTEWSMFRGLLQEVTRTDPVEALRDTAGRIVHIFDHLGLD